MFYTTKFVIFDLKIHQNVIGGWVSPLQGELTALPQTDPSCIKGPRRDMEGGVGSGTEAEGNKGGTPTAKYCVR